MSSQSLRPIVAIAIASLSLVAAGPADARSSSAKKAQRQLAKVVNRAHNRTVSTGKVKVDACKARHNRRDFTCRVSVQLLYADGSSRQCTDRTVRVRVGRKLRGASFLNPARYVCGPLQPGATQPTTPDGPAPITDEDPDTTTPTDDVPTGNEPPVSDDGPLGPPTGLPPFFPEANAKTDARSQPTERAGATGHARAGDTPSYAWRGWLPYFQWNGYYWGWAQWDYAYRNCYDDYFALYWWDGYEWHWAGAQWYRHFIYGIGQYDWNDSSFC